MISPIILWHDRVKEGVKLLDEKIPNWREVFRTVPRRELKISSIDNCVLGHIAKAAKAGTLRVSIPCVEGSFTGGKRILGIPPEESASKFGFAFHTEGWYDGAAYPILQMLWEKEIYGDDDPSSRAS